MTNPPGHLWRDKWTALSEPLSQEADDRGDGQAAGLDPNPLQEHQPPRPLHGLPPGGFSRLFVPKVDRFVPHTQHVNFRIVCETRFKPSARGPNPLAHSMDYLQEMCPAILKLTFTDYSQVDMLGVLYKFFNFHSRLEIRLL